MAERRARTAWFALAAFLAGCAPMPPEAKVAIADWRSGKADENCEIAGESIQWQADYCLATVQTDDLIAAQPCMDQESRRRRGEECALRRHYKQEWCRRVVDSGALQRSLAECIADPEQAGAIVKGRDPG